MEDFFLKNSKEMSNENMTMRKAALAAMPSGPVPCVAPAGKKRVEIYDPREGVKRKLEPYSANAKELYRFYIRELGFDETWIAPLPEALQAKKAIVNVQNKDQECFKWAEKALEPFLHLLAGLGGACDMEK